MKQVSLEMFTLYFIFLPFLFRQKHYTEMCVGEVGSSSGAFQCQLYNRLSCKPSHLTVVHQLPSLSSKTCGETQFVFVQNVQNVAIDVPFKENYRGSKANPQM